MKSKATSSDVAILIPGVEGMASVLETVAKYINSKAVCFQLGFKQLVPTIEEMGEILFNVSYFFYIIFFNLFHFYLFFD